MNDRDERRFAEVSHESVRLMAESAGVELDDDVAALLAEDVCYRLREATQVSAGSTRDRLGGLIAYITIIVITMFVTPTEQLSIHETCQKEKADSGGLQQSSALEQRGGGNLVILSLSSVLIYMNVRGHIFLLSFCASIRQFLVAARKMQPHFVP